MIIRKSALLGRVRHINEEWKSVEDDQGLVTFLRASILIDFLQLLNLVDRSSFIRVFGQNEGESLWLKEEDR